MAADLFTAILSDRTRSVNFFNGRLLSAEDLISEQKTNRLAHSLLGQAIGSGVVHGMEVGESALSSTQTNPVLMVRKGNPEGIKTLADLCGKGVGLQSGAVQVPIAEKASADCVAAGKPPVDIKQMGKDSEVQLLLRNNRIAVDLLDSPVAAYSAAQGGEFEVVPGERYEVRPHGVMVLKGNTQLAKAIKQALDELMADGTYKKVLDKYQVPDLAIDEAQISQAKS